MELVNCHGFPTRASILLVSYPQVEKSGPPTQCRVHAAAHAVCRMKKQRASESNKERDVVIAYLFNESFTDLTAPDLGLTTKGYSRMQQVTNGPQI